MTRKECVIKISECLKDSMLEQITKDTTIQLAETLYNYYAKHKFGGFAHEVIMPRIVSYLLQYHRDKFDEYRIKEVFDDSVIEEKIGLCLKENFS